MWGNNCQRGKAKLIALEEKKKKSLWNILDAWHHGHLIFLQRGVAPGHDESGTTMALHPERGPIYSSGWVSQTGAAGRPFTLAQLLFHLGGMLS